MEGSGDDALATSVVLSSMDDCGGDAATAAGRVALEGSAFGEELEGSAFVGERSCGETFGTFFLGVGFVFKTGGLSRKRL
jgi:hypothetical protein